MLIWLSIALLGISHGAYLVPLVQAVRKSQLPSPIDLVGLSAVAYFDIGMLLEGSGLEFRSRFFAPFFDASETNLIVAVILIAAAPWLMRFGAKRGPITEPGTRSTELRSGWAKLAFYGMLAAICITCLALPLTLIVLSPRLWESRALLGEQLGPWIIILSFPMYLLAFYVQLRDAKTGPGKCVLAFLLISATVSASAVGERTLVLLPGFIVLLFGQNFSVRRWTATIAIGALATTLMLPLFKSTYQDGGDSVAQLLADTVRNDLYRAPELAATLRVSSLVGGGSIPYPGAGYLYAACLFLPRSMAPFKGKSSAQQFTSHIMQEAPNSLTWGFGISAISEAVLNVGILFAPFVLLAYGAAIGWLTRTASKWNSLEIPVCLSALWIFGYHLSALLLNFGAMAIVGLVCQRIFTRASTDSDLVLLTGKGVPC
jgi:hypothetical protein